MQYWQLLDTKAHSTRCLGLLDLCVNFFSIWRLFDAYDGKFRFDAYEIPLRIERGVSFSWKFASIKCFIFTPREANSHELGCHYHEGPLSSLYHTMWKPMLQDHSLQHYKKKTFCSQEAFGIWFVCKGVETDSFLRLIFLMFVEQIVTSSPCKLFTKRRNRRRSLYFSSSRELQRSRMTRGKKHMSKTSNSTQEDLHKVLRFGVGGTSDGDNAGVDNLDAMQEMLVDIRHGQPVRRHESDENVSYNC